MNKTGKEKINLGHLAQEIIRKQRGFVDNSTNIFNQKMNYSGGHKLQKSLQHIESNQGGIIQRNPKVFNSIIDPLKKTI